jgi:hypothetical protein
MQQIIGYLDNKSIGYLDIFLTDNIDMTVSNKYPEFSRRLIHLWKECDVAPKNQTQLSKWLGFAQPTVNNWINGNALPGLETAVNLANKFECNPIWLITGKGNKEMDKVEMPSSPLLDKFNSLCAEQQKEVNEFIDFKLSQNNPNKPLTARSENVGGGDLPDPLTSYHRRQGDEPADKEFIEAVQHDYEDSK